MKKALVLMVVACGAASPAFSQGSSRSDERSSYSDRRDSDRGSWREDHGWRGMHDDDHSEGGKRGARFMVRSGDSRVAVQCDAGESMRSCVDATLTLLDRVRSQSGSATSGTAATTPNAGPGAAAPR